jgi:tetratricopeptide (TPR) repeat protein
MRETANTGEANICMATFQPKIKRVEGPLSETTQSVHDRIKTAHSLMKEERLEDAMVELEAALKLDPNSLPAHLAVATVKFRQKQFALALDHMKDVLRLDPMHLRAHLRCSQIYLAGGDYDKALTAAEDAIRIDPKVDVPHLAAGNICLLKGDIARAKEHLVTALRLNPRSARARQKMAKVLERDGQIDEALSQLNAAARVEPENASVFQDLGKLHLIRKDFSRAREAFEQSLQRNSTDMAGTQAGLAEALIGLRDLDHAEQILREITKDSRQGAKVHKLWGDIYHERGLFKEAVEEYESAKLLATEETIDSEALASGNLFADDDEQWKARAASAKATVDEAFLKQRTDRSGGKKRKNK